MVRTARWALVLALVVAGALRAETPSLVLGTSGNKVGAWEFQAGGLVLREGAAGGAFGTVRKGTPTHQFSYFVVLRHGFGSSSSTKTSEVVDTEDKKATTKQVVEVDGHKLTIGYQIDFDPRTKKTVRETITVNGKTVNAAKGRVLLVDLTVDPVKWQQKNLTLPTAGTAPVKKEEAEALTRKVLEALAKQDKATKAFIDKAK